MVYQSAETRRLVLIFDKAKPAYMFTSINRLRCHLQPLFQSLLNEKKKKKSANEPVLRGPILAAYFRFTLGDPLRQGHCNCCTLKYVLYNLAATMSYP